MPSSSTFTPNSRCVSSASPTDDDAVIAAPAATDNSSNQDEQEPAEIPPESNQGDGYNDHGGESRGDVTSKDDNGDGDDDDESEYEYEDDDDAAFSGFLLANEAHMPKMMTNVSSVPKKGNDDSSASAPAAIVEEEESQQDAAQGKKWREPSREAVSMSLRAQQETTGSKRRLAQDLYRIMNQDTEESGFSLAPKTEDSMDKWTIKLFQFDQDSNLAKDMLVLGIDHIQLEMTFPDQYPFEPPFVRVVKPRFKRQTGFVMNGALCMELLTKDGWNPINDIESVIVSIRSLLAVGDGRLQAAVDLPEARYQALLKAGQMANATGHKNPGSTEEDAHVTRKRQKLDPDAKPVAKEQVGTYTAAEAQAAYSHLSDYHKKKGWDTSGWWARKG